MKTTLIKNIKELAGIVTDAATKYHAGGQMAILNSIDDAYLIIEDDVIAAFGSMCDLKPQHFDEEIDASGKTLLPAWCDSHTHLVFPATREIEYIDKIKGLSYEDIARRGGGILNSAKTMVNMPEQQLFDDAWQRLHEIARWGTGAVEIKSGYGLSLDSELKMLRVIKRLKQKSELSIKSTFLGAHALPAEYKNNREGYLRLIIDEMLPAIAHENLADYIDVFCDKGFFTVDETDKILKAGARYNLPPKIHANELDFSGGVQIGVKHKARSVDHLEFVGEKEIAALLNSDTMPTVLPGAAFFLNMRYAPVRQMISAGLPLALATDFNPGSSPSGNMQWIISMASVLYKMLPNEAINAVTLNGAYAMGIEEVLGSITLGKKANLILTKAIPNIAYIPYYYGENKVDTIFINGKIINA
ncbi:imidazolonepropionase [Saccharicrinis carchari]|uniref:Imidazolonepropionase n=1 Tax=Saccharicrinis carchari TaxID=1168039 RepID=A0A521EBI5_SACCC|nr:imidazolonepropionase [Saccharicrinis carchari]SMO81273.1 imidazolonepropionase [Saccharicrinis carchari]